MAIRVLGETESPSMTPILGHEVTAAPAKLRSPQIRKVLKLLKLLKYASCSVTENPLHS